MKTELTPQEVAKYLNRIEKFGDLTGKALESVKYAACVVCKVDNGEYAPVVHAYWKEEKETDGSTFYGCSNCGTTVSMVFPKRWKACPYCTALMDGKDDSYEKEK